MLALPHVYIEQTTNRNNNYVFKKWFNLNETVLSVNKLKCENKLAFSNNIFHKIYLLFMYLSLVFPVTLLCIDTYVVFQPIIVELLCIFFILFDLIYVLNVCFCTGILFPCMCVTYDRYSLGELFLSLWHSFLFFFFCSRIIKEEEFLLAINFSAPIFYVCKARWIIFVYMCLQCFFSLTQDAIEKKPKI